MDQSHTKNIIERKAPSVGKTDFKYEVPTEVGQSIPIGDIHAVSGSLPKWRDTIGWAKRDKAITEKMTTGYPRLFQSPSEGIVERWAPDDGNLEALVFPTLEIAKRCAAYIRSFENDPKMRILSLELSKKTVLASAWTSLHIVICRPEASVFGRKFWQHTGEGISSRRAELALSLFDSYQLLNSTAEAGTAPGLVSPKVKLETSDTNGNQVCNNGRRYAETGIQEKFLMRERIADLVGNDKVLVPISDIFLYPSGMNSISDVYRALLLVYPLLKRTVTFGFVYLDTFKVLSTTGSKDTFLYGHGLDSELDDFERSLKGGEQILALFCEFPSNPLLRSPDIKRIRKLADEYGFAVVCDDTVGTSVNCDVLPWVDVLVTSLTKLFSGSCNVMGGSATINPKSKHHDKIHQALTSLYVDTYFPHDAIVMELNSRTFTTRVRQINTNAKSIAELLHSHPAIEAVYYPSLATKALYDFCKRPEGGYGYLITIHFKRDINAVEFLDALYVAKGPSLGTNFTLACAYTLFAHFRELEWAASYGVTEYLVRISVGMEPIEELREVFQNALGSMSLIGEE